MSKACHIPTYTLASCFHSFLQFVFTYLPLSGSAQEDATPRLPLRKTSTARSSGISWLIRFWGSRARVGTDSSCAGGGEDGATLGGSIWVHLGKRTGYGVIPDMQVGMLLGLGAI